MSYLGFVTMTMISNEHVAISIFQELGGTIELYRMWPMEIFTSRGLGDLIISHGEVAKLAIR